MSTSIAGLTLAGIVLALVQFVAALPWIWALAPQDFRRWARNLNVLGYCGLGILAAGVIIGLYLGQGADVAKLHEYGRYYAAILHVQLGVDVLIFLSRLPMLTAGSWSGLSRVPFLRWLTLVRYLSWPKGGAVMLATFRECVRQPMFWLTAGMATLLIVMSMVIPYFTFGEDYKMMKQLGFDVVMLATALFGLLAASISINEEIEGRTAITVMSKPINRRQFLIGKYLGILLACWAMTLLLGWVLNWTFAIKASGFFDRLDDIVDTMPAEVRQYLEPNFKSVVPTAAGEAIGGGAASWFGEAIAHHVGLFLNFGQVMILLAICTALATRMAFVVNLTICLVVFLIGHLAPTLVEVTRSLAAAPDASQALKLVNFLANLFNAVFPALEYFDMGPTIIRDNPVPMDWFCVYVFTVFVYSVLYTAIALIIGLILFEDRDLA